MTTPVPGKLTVGKDGRITGPAAITCNTPAGAKLRIPA